MMASAQPRPASSWDVFRHRDVACYCGSRFVSVLAIQMQNVAVGWRVYDLTGDPLALGLVGLAGFLPAICLALVTGHVADRFDRRTVLMTCYAVTTLTGVTWSDWGSPRRVIGSLERLGLRPPWLDRLTEPIGSAAAG